MQHIVHDTALYLAKYPIYRACQPHRAGPSASCTYFLQFTSFAFGIFFSASFLLRQTKSICQCKYISDGFRMPCFIVRALHVPSLDIFSQLFVFSNAFVGYGTSFRRRIKIHKICHLVAVWWHPECDNSFCMPLSIAYISIQNLHQIQC